MADSSVMGGVHALTVVVSGDVAVDWNLAREPLLADGEMAVPPRGSWQRGGAALLSDLVTTVAATTLGPGAVPVTVSAVDAPAGLVAPGDDSRNHSYAMWARYPRNGGGKAPGHAWRAVSYLGVDRARTDEVAGREWRRLEKEVPRADVVVLDDAALGFRDLSRPEVWRGAFAQRRPWIVLKQARPVARGALWDQLLAEAAGRLVVIVSIDDLRGREVQVSRGLSWERTAQDLLWEVVHKPDVNGLSRVAHTVVSFGADGAALVSGPSGDSALPVCTLFFDPRLAEGAWSAEHPGLVMGRTDCLTAAVVREILLSPGAPAFGRGIQSGVAAQRRLHLDGYEQRGPGRMELDFPVLAVAEELQAGREPLQQVRVPDPADAERYWTILQDTGSGDLAAKAAQIVVNGPGRALTKVPLGRFGKLVTADRSEIEAFRSIGTLIAEYATTPQAKPLSIAVFGPPGSGKSFGVKQVASAVAPGQIRKPLEFNLSQLRSPDELADAFHLVRDEGLAGALPLVFFDEFDTSLDGQPLGWLRYFLAPMQDGEFREGQLIHPIGRAVFVFAGGTCARVEDFGADMNQEEFRRAKGPDFMSRLKGYVNVLGPNPHGAGDPFWVVRRAILLRSLLERAAKGLFSEGGLGIDPGVLRAFLHTKSYRHGARSMEAVVATSRLAGRSVYERSSLPAEDQLDLHVDARDFLALVQRPDLEGDLLERLARAAHDVYCRKLRARGFRYGEVADNEHQISDSLVAYDDLPEYKKDQNRGTVRDIPAKLAQAGCAMVPAHSGLPPFAFTKEEIETLARQEHERWMDALGPGWTYGKPTDKARRVQEAYLPWDKLPGSQKDKDRDLVREIPRILHKAGYAVARTGDPHQVGGA